jgi:hypothetical protein
MTSSLSSINLLSRQRGSLNVAQTSAAPVTGITIPFTPVRAFRIPHFFGLCVKSFHGEGRLNCVLTKFNST